MPDRPLNRVRAFTNSASGWMRRNLAVRERTLPARCEPQESHLIRVFERYIALMLADDFGQSVTCRMRLARTSRSWCCIIRCCWGRRPICSRSARRSAPNQTGEPKGVSPRTKWVPKCPGPNGLRLAENYSQKYFWKNSTTSPKRTMPRLRWPQLILARTSAPMRTKGSFVLSMSART